jgi:hypothetical protein
VTIEMATCAPAAELRDAVAPIWHYLGRSPATEQIAALERLMPAQRVHSATAARRWGLPAPSPSTTLPFPVGGRGDDRRRAADAPPPPRAAAEDAQPARRLPSASARLYRPDTEPVGARLIAPAPPRRFSHRSTIGLPASHCLPAAPTGKPAQLRCGVSALGSACLGGISWSQPARALRVLELAPGATARADAVFPGSCAPWCPEIFCRSARTGAAHDGEASRHDGKIAGCSRGALPLAATPPSG